MTEALSPLVDSTDAGTAGEGGMWMGSSHSHGIDANTYSVIGQPSAASAVVTTSTEFASVPAVSYAIVAPPADFTGSTGAATTFAAYDSSNVTYQYNTDPSTTVSIDVAPVTVPSATGFTINLIWDAAALAAPASFRAGVQQAANLLMATITDHITVNLNIDYSGTGGGAAAGPDNGQFMSYATVRSDLIANAAPGDTTFNALPAGTSLQGQSNVVVWNAQLKLFGLLSANSATTDDGTATFATDINPALLPGVALHELTHALGRVPYGPEPDIFDLFRFTSVGTRLFDGNIPAAASYFSLNNGVTKLADYGQNSDTADPDIGRRTATRRPRVPCQPQFDIRDHTFVRRQGRRFGRRHHRLHLHRNAHRTHGSGRHRELSSERRW